MYYLGISYGMHDSAAALVKDGKMLFAVEEERLNGKKHTGNFPFRSIEIILEKFDLKINDIHCIGLNFIPELIKKKMILDYSMIGFPNNLKVFKGMKKFYAPIKKNVKLNIRGNLKYKGKIIYINHHFAHAASSYYCSGFNKSLVVVADGVGEFQTISIWIFQDQKFRLLAGSEYPNSIGLIYQIITNHLGLGMFGEGKTMGLAPYGEDRYRDFFDDLILETANGLILNKEYLNFPKGLLYINDAFNEKALNILGPKRFPTDPILKTHMNIANSLQKAIERRLISIIKKFMEKMKCEDLCLAGGVALNSVLNGKLLIDNICNKIFIQPAAGDSGTAVGAALYLSALQGDVIEKTQIKHVYWGPDYSSAEIRQDIEKFNLIYHESDHLCRDVAQYICDGLIVGWFQGKLEFGPRALGNRSILANPMLNHMKDHLNKKVKMRESFRPFAPVCTLENSKEYFKNITDSPFMLLVSELKDKNLFPAITHIDGTGRLQTVTKESNKLLWDLLNSFKSITGHPLLLNTSFNIKDKPIVCSPKDAIECFLGTDIDILVMNNFIITKDRNRDKCISEQKFSNKKNRKKLSKRLNDATIFIQYLAAFLQRCFYNFFSKST